MKLSRLRALIVAMLVLLVVGCSRQRTVVVTATPTLGAPESLYTECGESGCLGDTQVREIDGVVMVYVPAGEFEMGSDDEEVDAALQECNAYRGLCEREWFEDEQPRHTVLLDEFWIDRTEVSNAAYRRCVEAGVCEAPLGCEDGEPTYDDPLRSDHPVVCVDWQAAATYCEWVGGRLPTEAEWEVAARGPERRRYPWGEELGGEYLNLCDDNCELEWADREINDGHATTAPVESYEAGASWCGALNLVGNVWEWMQDWYGEYPFESQVNPTGPDYFTANRVIRGGSWVNTRVYVRAALRNFESPDGSDTTAGFRCVRSDSP